MKMWQIIRPGAFSLAETKEALEEGHVKVRLQRCAISILDMDYFTGMNPAAYPFVPVRLGAGVVSEAGEKTMMQRGQRVVIEPYLKARGSDNRSDGQTMTMGKTTDGLLRDFISVPAANAHLLPDHVTDDEAVLTDMIAIALSALDKLQLQKGEHVAIIGASATGILMAELAIYYQAVPILIDARQDMLDVAAASGIYYTVNTSQTDALQKVIEITGGRLCDAAAYITTASDKAQRTLDFSSKGGRVVFVGVGNIQNTLTVSLNSIISKNLTISSADSGEGFTGRAINMLANKAVDVKPLITRTVGFDEVPDLLQQLAERPFMNVIINVKI